MPARKAKQRRLDILQSGQTVISLTKAHVAVASLPHEDHRHIRRPFVEGLFRPHIVIAQHVAMIRSEHDDGLIKNALFADGANQGADLLVDMGAQGMEGMTRAADLMLGIYRPRLNALQVVG